MVYVESRHLFKALVMHSELQELFLFNEKFVLRLVYILTWSFAEVRSVVLLPVLVI